MSKTTKGRLKSVLIMIGLGAFFILGPKDSKANLCIKHPKDLANLFPKTASQIKDQEKFALDLIDQTLTDILLLPKEKHSFNTLMQPIDDIKYKVGTIVAVFGVLSYLSPNANLRTQAQTSSINISQAINKKITLNKELYLILSAYINSALSSNIKNKNLTAEQKYFMQNMLAEFKRNGLDLANSELAKIELLLNEITELEQKFLANLSEDCSQITVKKHELNGLPDDFINNLTCDNNSNLIVKCDDHSYIQVMQNCTNAQTREKLYRARIKRAYPQNLDILKNLIAKRNQLAQILGFKSYAHLDLDDQMAGSPEQAQNFLLKLLPMLQAKVKCELLELKKDLPENLVLIDDKIKPWDMGFIKNQYKRKHLAIDEQLISEYFTQPETIKKLLGIYENFLGLRFEFKKVKGLWVKNKDLQTIAVYKKNSKKLIGYLILDLFARADKLPHAGAQISIVPAVKNKLCPAVSVVFTNLPKAQGAKPVLMTYEQVRTFFHEFGHAMHALLGKTELACHAGTNVKTDFVEMPSQMLEYWLAEAQTLAQISKHYQTGKALPKDLILKIIKSQNFDAGDFNLRQINLSLLSLELYNADNNKDLEALRSKLAMQTSDYLLYDPQDMSLASFMHVASSNYGSKYYSYLWSRVFACDIFAHIKEHGLDNPAIGKRYITEVLSKGGSCEPQELLVNFLSREPNQEAFKKALGI